jgi:hypothetical protein
VVELYLVGARLKVDTLLRMVNLWNLSEDIKAWCLEWCREKSVWALPCMSDGHRKLN